jgi:hypothetical protein
MMLQSRPTDDSKTLLVRCLSGMRKWEHGEEPSTELRSKDGIMNYGDSVEEITTRRFLWWVRSWAEAQSRGFKS